MILWCIKENKNAIKFYEKCPSRSVNLIDKVQICVTDKEIEIENNIYNEFIDSGSSKSLVAKRVWLKCNKPMINCDEKLFGFAGGVFVCR